MKRDYELEGQTDVQGDPFTYVYQMANRSDQYHNLAVQVPILFGVQHKKFYLLAGVKIDANVLTKAYTSARLNTLGRYDATDDYTNMPEYQFFNDVKKSNSEKAKLNLGLNLSIEAGGRIGEVYDEAGFDVPKRKIEYRLAGFIDYGVLNLLEKGTNAAIVYPTKYDSDKNSPTYVYNPDGTNTSMINDVKVSHIMGTNGFANAVNNLTIGIKFTVLFQLPEKGKCVICDYDQPSFRRSGGSRGMKYEE